MPIIKVKSEEVKIKVPITTLRIEPTTQTKTVEPSIEEQVITPDEGIFALSSVTVNPVTSEIDENIKAENIKEGVSILGVEGNVASSDYNVLYDESSTRESFISNITKISTKGTISRTNFDSFFNGFVKLEALPSIDTSNTETMQYMLLNCSKVKIIQLLDFSKTKNINGMLSGCTSLEELGGFKDLGKAYETSRNTNYILYKLNLSRATKLTEQSLINVLNNLYDIASIGVKTQQCELGSTNIAKLTSAEGQQALTNATAKGWTVS